MPKSKPWRIIFPGSDGGRFQPCSFLLQNYLRSPSGFSHRSFVDFVVTEQGIARLRGKSLRARLGEMISIAHPDFRAELKKDAQRIYGITV